MHILTWYIKLRIKENLWELQSKSELECFKRLAITHRWTITSLKLAVCSRSN